MVPSVDQQWTFGQAGVYDFVCDVHPTTMTGTIIVEGDPVETATPTHVHRRRTTPTRTADGDADVRRHRAPGRDGHARQPPQHARARQGRAHGHEAPQLTGVKAKAVSAGAKLSFSVSEPVTLKITARRGKRTVTSATLHVAAGKRSVTLRSSSLRKKGTYSLELRAVDAMANAASPVKTTLKVKR